MADFLFQAVMISLCGVMSPGPITAATWVAGSRRRHAGLLVALGHGAVEIPLILMISAGVGELLQSNRAVFTTTVGLAGGAVLVWMGVQGLLDLRKPAAQSEASGQRHPFWTGLLVTGTNPYFIIWWVTIGLALILRGAQLGALAFALFILCHWLCDLVWFEILSMASFKGAKVLGGGTEKAVLALCAAVLLVFGGKFIIGAVWP